MKIAIATVAIILIGFSCIALFGAHPKPEARCYLDLETHICLQVSQESRSD